MNVFFLLIKCVQFSPGLLAVHDFFFAECFFLLFSYCTHSFGRINEVNIRQRVVPHFQSGILEQAKYASARENRHSLISLALLFLRKMRDYS